MNDIRPFSGLRYDEQVAGPLSDLVCPPYDIISPVEQLELHGRSPNNMIRLELGLEYPEDDTSSNRYRRATETLERWLTGGILKEDEPSVYLYEQRFPMNGAQVTRMSVIARLRLTPWEEGVVLPHEDTLTGPKVDRLRLMRATACNLSPVYLVFDDPSETIGQLLEGISALPPWEVAQTGDGQEHRLWVLRGELSEQIVMALREPQLYMADGHHRYETALAYRDEMMAADPAIGEDSGVNFVMALMVDSRTPGLVILPTHRLIGGVNEDRLHDLDARLERQFEVESLTLDNTEADRAAVIQERIRVGGELTPTLGMYSAGMARLLRLRDQSNLPHTGSRPVLDVDILHGLVLEPLLGIGQEELNAGLMVGYTHDARDAVEAVDRGKAQVAFFLNPTRIEQVLETARSGGRMPQKSTYFYPKPQTGLVINPLWT